MMTGSDPGLFVPRHLRTNVVDVADNALERAPTVCEGCTKVEEMSAVTGGKNGIARSGAETHIKK